MVQKFFPGDKVRVDNVYSTRNNYVGVVVEYKELNVYPYFVDLNDGLMPWPFRYGELVLVEEAKQEC